jgi:hypothetical protein
MDNIEFDKEMKEIIREVMEEERLKKQFELDYPILECHKPKWRANTEKCSGCVTRTYSDNISRGCKFCDEFWDCPDLVK